MQDPESRRLDPGYLTPHKIHNYSQKQIYTTATHIKNIRAHIIQHIETRVTNKSKHMNLNSLWHPLTDKTMARMTRDLPQLFVHISAKLPKHEHVRIPSSPYPHHPLHQHPRSMSFSLVPGLLIPGLKDSSLFFRGEGLGCHSPPRKTRNLRTLDSNR